MVESWFKVCSFVRCSRCGPARHAVEAARQGVGLVTAIDDNLTMLEFAQRQAAEAGAAVTFLHGRLEEVFGSSDALPVSSLTSNPSKGRTQHHKYCSLLASSLASSLK